jgi:enamine deaminase RidA (YjgF/YER057c/UK114 family)
VNRQNVSSGNPYEDVYGYCRAVRVGDQIHVAGTTAPGDDAYTQARAALRIIAQALTDVGSSVAAVVRTVTYVTDMADADQVAKAHLEVFGDIRPAGTLVGVSALLNPDLKVEIEAYAVES